jgi:hypothetical protein
MFSIKYIKLHNLHVLFGYKQVIKTHNHAYPHLNFKFGIMDHYQDYFHPY